MTPENNFAALRFALKVVKGLKEAVLDAGMRTTGENNFRPRNRKRTEAHHGTEAKATGEEIACSSRAKKETSLDEMQLHCCTSGALWTSTDVVASNWPSVTREKRRDELHHLIMFYAAATASALHYYVLCTVRRFDLVPPPVRYVQELKAVMSGSCVECEHTAAMWQRKELECNGSIRSGDVVQVQQLLQRFKSERR